MNIKIGDTVQWTKWEAGPANEWGHLKHIGKVLALVPAGADINYLCQNEGIEVKRSRFGSASSKNYRAVVSVMGGAKGTLEYHYAPRIGQLEIVE